MRTITAAQSAVLSAGVPAEHLRVQIYDSNASVWRDISTWPGTNLVDSASWQEDVDSPGATASISLKREVEKLSLSPFVAGSALNRAFDPSAGAVPLLALGREIKIDAAVVPMDTAPASGDWMTVFHGYIDTVDPAAGAAVGITARDLSAKVIDTFIETERVYSYGASGVAMRVWEANTAYALNEYILPSESKRNGKYYKCTTAGTSGTTEPAWPASSTVTDGGAVHTYESTTTTAGTDVEAVMQSILDGNGLSAVTLDVPSSPSWAITQFIQQRQGTFEAIRTLAQQIGWDVRYVWKAASSAFVLRLFQPDRTKAVADRTFAASDYEDIRRLAMDISGIRNAIRVIYSDVADLWPDGTPKRKVINVSDSTSITKYGRRFMEIAEDSASQIDSSGEATAMANACLSDLMEPSAEAEVQMVQGFPWVELGDLYAFTANARHFDSDQTLAVYGWSHEAREGHITTSLRLRGKPSGGFDRWHQVSVRPSGKGGHKTVPFQTTGGSTIVVTPTIGGARVGVTVAPDRVANVEEFEHHVSSSASFTPSSSTLIEVSKSRTVEVSNLIPGATYYHAAVLRTRNSERIVRAQKSAETSFVAGRASAGHILSRLDTSKTPLNGSFETQIDDAGLPDYWMTDGLGGVAVVADGSGSAGGQYVSMANHAGDALLLYSALFEVRGGVVYGLDVWHKEATAPSTNFKMLLSWYDYSASEGDVTLGAISTTSVSITTSDVWAKETTYAAAPSTARFARAAVKTEDAATRTVYVDGVRAWEASTAGVFGWGNGSGPSTAVTHYLSPARDPATSGATEVKFPVPSQGIIRNLRINFGTASTNVDYVFTIRVGGSDSTITASVAAGATSGSDLTHVVAVAAGGLLSLKMASTQNGGGGYVGAAEIMVTLEYER